MSDSMKPFYIRPESRKIMKMLDVQARMLVAKPRCYAQKLPAVTITVLDDATIDKPLHAVKVYRVNAITRSQCTRSHLFEPMSETKCPVRFGRQVGERHIAM